MRRIGPSCGLAVLAFVAVGAFAASGGAASASAPIGAYTTKGAFTFTSEPALHPPKVKTDVPTRKGLAPGYFMTDTSKSLSLKQRMVGRGGPVIYDRHLQPVWVRHVPTSDLSLNLIAQTYQGKPVLTWWQGKVAPSNGPLNAETGVVTIVDNHYRTITRLQATDGWVLSPHEFLIEGQNALVTAYKNVPYDLTPYGGKPNGMLVDTAVQEYNIKTGALVWQWDTLAHVSPAESYAKIGGDNTLDPYHLNSIDASHSGKLLISLRNTWALYQLDRATGNIDWRLAGKKSDFKLGSGAAFSWQHHSRYLPNDVISVFDDGCCPASGPQANGPGRGLFLKLDMTNHTATVQRAITHHGLEVGSQGSVQVVPGGNIMIGWGQQPWFSEYGAQGKLLFDARYPGPDISYRVYLQRWNATPYYRPRVAVRRHRGRVTVHASWNGATNVVRWQLMAGTSGRHLTTVKRTRRTGFETTIAVSGGRFFKARALDRRGHVIGTSAVARVRAG